jgi:predicted Rossmann-fold nucleotide-binding protein
MELTEYVEIEAIAELRGRSSLDRCCLQGLDLVSAGVDWARLEVTDRSVFLGCRLNSADEAELRSRGAVFFPRFAEFPYDPYRPRLYDTAELMVGYDSQRFEATAADQAIYRSFMSSRKRHSAIEALAQRLHDWAVSDALEDTLIDCGRFFRRGVVGVMGSHQTARDSDSFREIALLTHRLSRAGFLIVTGGGPGAMEAGNLGAFLACEEEAAVDEAVARLKAHPHAGPPVPAGYLRAAQDVIAAVAKRSAREWGFAVPHGARPDQSDFGWSLAIPTWTYGHEASNLFASHVAKLFQNSVREEGLVSIASAGLVFAPGKAGTCQEAFTDAVQNYYAKHPGDMLPMVFWPRRYWTETIPVLDCLEKLARAGERKFIKRVGAFDSIDEIVAFLLEPPPIA